MSNKKFIVTREQCTQQKGFLAKKWCTPEILPNTNLYFSVEQEESKEFESVSDNSNPKFQHKSAEFHRVSSELHPCKLIFPKVLCKDSNECDCCFTAQVIIEQKNSIGFLKWYSCNFSRDVGVDDLKPLIEKHINFYVRDEIKKCTLEGLNGAELSENFWQEKFDLLLKSTGMTLKIFSVDFTSAQAESARERQVQRSKKAADWQEEMEDLQRDLKIAEIEDLKQNTLLKIAEKKKRIREENEHVPATAKQRPTMGELGVAESTSDELKSSSPEEKKLLKIASSDYQECHRVLKSGKRPDSYLKRNVDRRFKEWQSAAE